MSQSQSTIQRARELGLPTNLEEAVPTSVLWYTKNGSLPFKIAIEPALLFNMNDDQGQCLFPTEKEAIEEAKKHAQAIEERWRRRINTLDDRHDALEDVEMASK